MVKYFGISFGLSAKLPNIKLLLICSRERLFLYIISLSVSFKYLACMQFLFISVNGLLVLLFIITYLPFFPIPMFLLAFNIYYDSIYYI